MRIAIVGFKGGVGKTTTAVHLAAYFQRKAPTLLIDGDPNRSASLWAEPGKLPFSVEDERKAARSGSARQFVHIIIDTEARPSPSDLKDLAEDSDLIVVPTTPDKLSLDALRQTLDALRGIEGARYKALLTICPPPPNRDSEEARSTLAELGWPLFETNVRRLIAFSKAAVLGVSVQDVPDPRARLGWADYEQAGKEIERRG